MYDMGYCQIALRNIICQCSYAANDLQKYTDMTMSTVTQRQSIYYNGSFNLLQYMVSQISGDIHTVESGAEKERPHQKVDLI